MDARVPGSLGNNMPFAPQAALMFLPGDVYDTYTQQVAPTWCPCLLHMVEG